MTRQGTGSLTRALAIIAVLLVAPALNASAAPTPISACGTISATGSYVLTQNLTTSGDCLTVSAPGVSINLNGFKIGGASATGTAIKAALGTGYNGLNVHNGVIANFIVGIYAGGNAVRIENVKLLGASGTAISVGDNAFIKDTTIAPGASGISAGNGLRLIDSAVINGVRAVSAGDNACVSGNWINGNHSGFLFGNNSLATGNHVSLQTVVGISAGTGALLIGNGIANNCVGISAAGGESAVIHNIIAGKCPNGSTDQMGANSSMIENNVLQEAFTINCPSNLINDGAFNGGSIVISGAGCQTINVSGH